MKVYECKNTTQLGLLSNKEFGCLIQESTHDPANIFFKEMVMSFQVIKINLFDDSCMILAIIFNTPTGALTNPVQTRI